MMCVQAINGHDVGCWAFRPERAAEFAVRSVSRPTASADAPAPRTRSAIQR